MRVSALWIVCVCGASLWGVTSAWGDQEPPLGALNEPGQAAIDPVDLRKRADPAASRSLALSSAETLHEGEVVLSSYDILALEISYGWTDRLTLSASCAVPVGALAFAVGGKLQLVRTARLLFSVQVTAGGVFPFWSDASVALLGLNLLADVILDRDGDVALSFTSQSWLGVPPSDVTAGAFALTAALNARVARWMKLLLEVVVAPAAWYDEAELDGAATVIHYGARLFGEVVALDVAFLLPVHPSIPADLGFLVMGVPHLALSARY